jgi:hypothetical protein
MSFGLIQQLMLLGLAGISLPVIAHLLSKRKFDVVFWGAMQFLEMGRKTRRRIRLEELLLLLLRIGVISLLVFAFARPWGKGGVLSAMTEAVRRDIVFVVDGSYSMGWQGGNETPHNAARQWVHEAVGQLHSGDTVSLIDAREQVLPVIEMPTSDMRIVREAVDEIPPPSGSSRLALAATKAVQLLSKTTNPIREVVILTDGQAYPWSPDDAALWARFDDLRSQQAISPRIWIVDRLAGADQPRTNFSVDRLQLSRSTTVPDFPLRIRTTVRQTGGTAAQKSVFFAVNGQRLQDKTTIVNLPPDGEAPVEFEHRFASGGSYLVTVSIEPDSLPGDDDAHAAVVATPGVPTLLVDGKPHLDPVRSKSFFLRAAVSATTNDAPWVRSETVAASDFKPSLLENRDVVALLDVAELSAESLKSLEQFVERGGGLIVAPGNLAKPEFYNGPFAGLGQGLAPAGLERVVSESEGAKGPMTVDGDSFEIPWMSRFKPGAAVDLGTVRFNKWWLLKPPDNADEAKLPNRPEISKTVVAGKLKNGNPWIITRRYGEGHVAILAAPLDSEWSTLPSKNDFVPFVHELIFSLVSRNEGRNVNDGMPLELPLANGANAEGIEFLAPDGKKLAAQAGGDEQRPTARLDAATMPGVYQAIRKSRPQDPPQYFVVEFDRREADLKPLDEAGRKTLAGDNRLKFLETPRELAAAAASDAPRTELWWLLLLFVVGMLVVEVAMTRRLVRGGHELDPSLEPSAG